jgi:hypothetical protein
LALLVATLAGSFFDTTVCFFGFVFQTAILLAITFFAIGIGAMIIEFTANYYLYIYILPTLITLG